MLKKVTKKDILQYTWFYWGQNKKIIPVLFAGLTLAAIADALFPLFIGRMVNELTNIDMTDISIPKSVFVAFAALIALDVGYHTARHVTYLIFNKYMAMPNLQRIALDGFDKVQKFSSDWHANNFGGATVRKITRGMWAFDRFEDILVLYFFPTAIVMLTIIVVMTIKWPLMGLVTVAMMLIYLLITLWTVLKINAPYYRAHAEEDTKMGAAIADAITSNQTVKAFGNEEYEYDRFNAVSNRWRGIALTCWQVGTWTDWFRRLVSSMMMVCMLGTILYLLKQGKADVGDVVYVFTTVWVIFAYLRHIGQEVSNLQKSVSEMEDIIFYWKTDINVKDKPEAITLQAKEGKIDFNKINFSYGNQETPIYQDFSMHIKPDEKVALVGHSGSGKSTFVKLLQRLYDIQGGEILIDGTDIANVTQSSLRKAVALVPQDPILFHRTLRDNIAYAKPDATEEEVMQASKRAYAHEFIAQLPKGYDTLVGERGIKLSGGERQRVAIARAILSDSPILILDEATSALDSISEDYIQKGLVELMKGRTSITIAHRLSTIKDVDRILVFDQGRIIEEGTHHSLLENENSHYKKLYDMQVMGLVT